MLRGPRPLQFIVLHHGDWNDDGRAPSSHRDESTSISPARMMVANRAARVGCPMLRMPKTELFQGAAAGFQGGDRTHPLGQALARQRRKLGRGEKPLHAGTATAQHCYRPLEPDRPDRNRRVGPVLTTQSSDLRARCLDLTATEGCCLVAGRPSLIGLRMPSVIRWWEPV